MYAFPRLQRLLLIGMLATMMQAEHALVRPPVL